MGLKAAVETWMRTSLGEGVGVGRGAVVWVEVGEKVGRSAARWVVDMVGVWRVGLELGVAGGFGVGVGVARRRFIAEVITCGAELDPQSRMNISSGFFRRTLVQCGVKVHVNSDPRS